MLSWSLRLFPDQVEGDLSPVRACAVFEEVDALPCAQCEVAIDTGIDSCTWVRAVFRCAGISSGAFGVVFVRAILWRETIEVGFDVAAYCGIGILLDEERG